jgi:hypothetical protein
VKAVALATSKRPLSLSGRKQYDRLVRNPSRLFEKPNRYIRASLARDYGGHESNNGHIHGGTASNEGITTIPIFISSFARRLPLKRVVERSVPTEPSAPATPA